MFFVENFVLFGILWLKICVLCRKIRSVRNVVAKHMCFWLRTRFCLVCVVQKFVLLAENFECLEFRG